VSLGPAVVSAASVLPVALGGLPAGHRRFERADLGGALRRREDISGF
jgi:hypothetical protein